MDVVHGNNNFKNELIWHYKSGGRQENAFSRKHDTIFFYSKNIDTAIFNSDSIGVERGIEKRNNMKKGVDDDGRVYFSIKSAGKLYKYYEDEKVVPDDVWSDISHIQQKDPQRVGFLTQKPEHLLQRILLATTNSDDSCLDYFAGSGTTLAVAQKIGRKWIGIEFGTHFYDVILPRLSNVLNGKTGGISKDVEYNGGGFFKYIRLESYEDTLNNLRLDQNSQRQKMLTANPALKEDYILRYQLDVETRGSQSLLNIDGFADPTAYTLDVKKPGTDEYATRPVDLIETFNYLIGLRVVHYDAPQEFTANFKRVEDPEVPSDQKTKLVLDGKLRQIKASHEDTKERRGEREKTGPGDSSVEMERGYGNSDVLKEEDIRGFVPSCETSSPVWWFRKVEGWVPANPQTPNDGQKEKVLVVWRKLTDDIERDNLMLDEWFTKMRINTRDFEFDTIYVNGSNNLPNLKLDNENWKVRLIEEEFMKRMWEAQE